MKSTMYGCFLRIQTPWVINWRTYTRYCEEGEQGIMEMMGFRFFAHFEHRFYKKDSENSPRTLAAKAEITEVVFSKELHSKVPLTHIIKF